jgi:hypothetical protein
MTPINEEDVLQMEALLDPIVISKDSRALFIPISPAKALHEIEVLAHDAEELLRDADTTLLSEDDSLANNSEETEALREIEVVEVHSEELSRADSFEIEVTIDNFVRNLADSDIISLPRADSRTPEMAARTLVETFADLQASKLAANNVAEFLRTVDVASILSEDRFFNAAVSKREGVPQNDLKTFFPIPESEYVELAETLNLHITALLKVDTLLWDSKGLDAQHDAPYEIWAVNQFERICAFFKHFSLEEKNAALIGKLPARIRNHLVESYLYEFSFLTTIIVLEQADSFTVNISEDMKAAQLTALFATVFSRINAALQNLFVYEKNIAEYNIALQKNAWEQQSLADPTNEAIYNVFIKKLAHYWQAGIVAPEEEVTAYINVLESILEQKTYWASLLPEDSSLKSIYEIILNNFWKQGLIVPAETEKKLSRFNQKLLADYLNKFVINFLPRNTSDTNPIAKKDILKKLQADTEFSDFVLFYQNFGVDANSLYNIVFNDIVSLAESAGRLLSPAAEERLELVESIKELLDYAGLECKLEPISNCYLITESSKKSQTSEEKKEIIWEIGSVFVATILNDGETYHHNIAPTPAQKPQLFVKFLSTVANNQKKDQLEVKRTIIQQFLDVLERVFFGKKFADAKEHTPPISQDSQLAVGSSTPSPTPQPEIASPITAPAPKDPENLASSGKHFYNSLAKISEKLGVPPIPTQRYQDSPSAPAAA